MTNILEIREKIKWAFEKYDRYAVIILRFLLGLCVFWLINRSVGFIEELSSIPVVLILALICCLPSLNVMIVLASLMMTAELASVSLEGAAVFLALLILLFLLYFRFTPKDALFLLLMPVLSVFGLQYAVPVTAGLAREPHTAISVGFGSVIYYIIHVIEENAGLIVSESGGGASVIKLLISQFTQNKIMLVSCAVYVLTTILVYIIRRLSIDNAWGIAIISGIIFQFVVLLTAGFALHAHVNIIFMIVGLAVSAIICFVYQFFAFDLDYTRTERAQFEDDEYYYYIKAVPKRVVEISDKQIKSINKNSNTINMSSLAKEFDFDEQEKE